MSNNFNMLTEFTHDFTFKHHNSLHYIFHLFSCYSLQYKNIKEYFSYSLYWKCDFTGMSPLSIETIHNKTRGLIIGVLKNVQKRPVFTYSYCQVPSVLLETTGGRAYLNLS